MSSDSPRGGAAEQTLLDIARRAAQRPRLRQAAPWAMALHLSRLPPPAPRPHQRRIARALLQEAAQHHAGQMLALGGGDLVLLCQDTAIGSRAPPEPTALPSLLHTLLQADAPPGEALVSVWTLPQDAAGLLAYATARTLDPPPAGAEPKQNAGRAETPEALRRQTAILLPPPGQGRARLSPLFREVASSPGAAEPQPDDDAYLLRHFAARRDPLLLGHVAAAWGAGGALDATAGPPLHLVLALSGLLSPPFARFAQACAASQVQAGVSLGLAEACADPPAFGRAKNLLREAGLALALDGVTHHALNLACLPALGADLLKLDWTTRLETAAAPELAAELAAIGPQRLVLRRAESEAALRWGLRHGIRRFQGAYAESMLAASRLSACPHRGGCTLGQCAERAAATAPEARRFCRNPALLDAAAPEPPRAALLAA